MKKILLLAIAAVCFSTHGIAKGKAAPAAHIAAPEQYEVLLENKNVLVLKMVLAPGESDNWHSHRAETVYFGKGGKAAIRTEQTVMDLDIPDGHTMWHDAWAHQMTNNGNSPIVAIIVEQK